MREPTRGYRIYVMVGTPGSGKSTWAKTHLPHVPYVSRDAVRYEMLKPDEGYFSREKETFKVFIERIVENVYEHGECVVDASHLNKFSRIKLFNALDCAGMRGWYDSYMVTLDMPLAVCLSRNAGRTGRERVPDDAVTDMFNKMTIPQMSEHLSIKGIWLIRE